MVDAFRICPSLNLSRASFLALDKAARDQVKHVPFFVAATFSESPSRRDLEHAHECNLIFLDIDAPDDLSKPCPASPFVNNPQTLYTALEGFNFAAHTTASSTLQRPRLRVIVDAEAIPLRLYRAAVATLWRLLGLLHGPRTGFKESQVAVQPMFLPTLFSDSTEEDHPLIAHRTDAGQFMESDITPDSNFLPNGSKESRTPHTSAHLRTPPLLALDFLRAPVPEITLQVATEALEHVDPDCSYFDWLEVATALRHQFSPRQSKEAYTLFDEWSQTGSKYQDSSDTRAKWDSIRQTPLGRLPITIRSLLKQAQAGGWDDKRIKESAFGNTSRWLDEVSTITELMEHGARKILGTPLLSAVQEDVLVHQLVAQARKRFVYVISPTAIRKDMARLKAEMRAQSASPDKAKEPLWAKGVCYISAARDFYRHRTGEKYKAESFNAIYSRHLLPTEEQLKEMGKAVTPATLATPLLDPADYALNHIKIPTFYDYTYDPSRPTDMLVVTDGKKLINQYHPTYPELDMINAQTAGNLLDKHLKQLIAEMEYRKILIDFMAFQVQVPGRKVRWAVLIQSVEGAGKTFLSEAMKSVLGQEHVKTISGAVIRSGYNDWAFGYQLVVLEEVRAAGTSKHDIMNTLKELVTNDTITINEKYRNSRCVANVSNYMMFSNHHDALALTPGDRRYFVIKSPLQSKDQVLALGDNYFPPLYAMLRDHPGALRAFLMEHEISPGFHPDGHAPRTRYIEDLINDSASDLTAAVRRLILEGDHPLIQYDIVSARALHDVLQLEEGLGRSTAQQVAQVLRDEGFHQHGRHLFGTDRHYLWVRQGINGGRDPVEVAAERLQKNLRNLCMELIYG